jgi:hypothetical protein
MTIWNLDVDRVRIVGGNVDAVAPAELRALVAEALENVLETAPLPPGRAARAVIEVRVPSLTGPAAIADAVAKGVAKAMGGPARG